MEPFKRTAEAQLWVKQNARGEVCVIVSNQRMKMNPWCDGDMRLYETRVGAVWQ